MHNAAKRLVTSILFMGQASWVMADSIADFAFFQDEAKVITASRREEPIRESPVAIDVITAQDIKASGASNLWDLLRYEPGVNVIDGFTVDDSNNRAIVSIRGFAEPFVKNVLVLVDGRPVSSPVTGGVFWDQLPVQIQDIDRIEIIRGPNAALYGSGAGLGAINIITRTPSLETSVELDERGGNRNAVQSYMSANTSAKTFAYQLSHTFQQNGNSDNSDGTTGNNFYHSNKANWRSHWSTSDNSALELFAGGSWQKVGVPNVFDSQDNFTQHFEMLNYHLSLSEDSKLELMSSRNDFVSDINPLDVGDLGHLHTNQYDEQIRHQIDWADGRMKSTYGFDYEKVRAYSDAEFADNQSVQNQVARSYINQTARLTPSLLWVGAFSWETTYAGSPHPNYQVSQLWEPTREHSFRISYSVSHTIPSLRLLDLNSQTGGGVPLFGNLNLLPEKLTSYETGYRGDWLDHHLSAEADLFYTHVENISDSVFTSDQMTQKIFVNDNQAIAKGSELQFKYRFDSQHSVYVNYTYEHITDWQGDAGNVTQNTPEHAVNFGAVATIGHGFSGSFNVGYKDNYFMSGPSTDLAVPAYWRLDARVAYQIPRYRDAEVFISGQNLAVSEHTEYGDGLSVPRTYQGGISIKFGGKK
jgi:iron complex outermembrane receptor protein